MLERDSGTRLAGIYPKRQVGYRTTVADVESCKEQHARLYDHIFSAHHVSVWPVVARAILTRIICTTEALSPCSACWLQPRTPPTFTLICVFVFILGMPLTPSQQMLGVISSFRIRELLQLQLCVLPCREAHLDSVWHGLSRGNGWGLWRWVACVSTGQANVKQWNTWYSPEDTFGGESQTAWPLGPCSDLLGFEAANQQKTGL